MSEITIPVRIQCYGDWMVITVGKEPNTTVTAYHIGDLFGMTLFP